MRQSINYNTNHYDNGNEKLEITSLVTDIVLEVCWTFLTRSDLRHCCRTVTSLAGDWQWVLLWHGVTAVGSRLFPWAGHIQFWLCDKGFSWWFRRFSQMLSVSAVDCSVICLNSVQLLVKSYSNLSFAPRLVAKFEWPHFHNVTLREAGQVYC